MSFKIFALISSLCVSLAYGGDVTPMTTDKKPVVVFETTEGIFEVTLNPEVAPKTCENFLGLVQKH